MEAVDHAAARAAAPAFLARLRPRAARSPGWADDGAAAYSGSWVRQITGAANGFWLPTVPGAIYFASGQVKRTAGTGSGGRLNIGFYPTLGSFAGALGTTSSVYVTAGAWTLASVTSAAAPAGTNAAYISYEAASGDTVQFDALYARRVLNDEVAGATTGTLTAGTGWSLTNPSVRRIGGVVTFYVFATTTAAAPTLVFATLPTAFRPSVNVSGIGIAYIGASVYVAYFSIAVSGQVTFTWYDNGTALVGPPGLAIGDRCELTATFTT